MHYIAQFSIGVEYIRSLDKEKILYLVPHPVIIGDILLCIIVEKEDLANLPFKSYHDDPVLCEEKHGGLKVWKVNDVEVHRGINCYNDICLEYGYLSLLSKSDQE